MSETVLPIIQIECNTAPSRHEQGIPRFLSRTVHPQPQPQQSSSMMQQQQQQQQAMPSHPGLITSPSVPHAAFSTQYHQSIPGPSSVQMMSALAPTFNHGFNQNVGNRTKSNACGPRSPPPTSPSMSSTVSSVSVYEDCMSMPPPPPGKSTSMTSIQSDCSSNSSLGNVAATGFKPEQALSMVNEKLRQRISDLEKKMQRAMAEVIFLGDRNWRLEAYVDSLMHTLEILGITDVEDLTGDTLPLPMFRVKVKAGYRLGPFNRLPRRAMWSYEESSKNPPYIDLSADRARTLSSDGMEHTNDEYPEDNELELPAGTDIGLSVRQMFHYERQIEELNQEKHGLATTLDQTKTNQRELREDIRKNREENIELADDLEDTKAELGRVIQRLQKYEDVRLSNPPPRDSTSEQSSGSSSSYSGYRDHHAAARHHSQPGLGYRDRLLRERERERDREPGRACVPYFCRSRGIREPPVRGPRDARAHGDMRDSDRRQLISM